MLRNCLTNLTGYLTFLMCREAFGNLKIGSLGIDKMSRPNRTKQLNPQRCLYAEALPEADVPANLKAVENLPMIADRKEKPSFRVAGASRETMPRDTGNQIAAGTVARTARRGKRTVSDDDPSYSPPSSECLTNLASHMPLFALLNFVTMRSIFSICFWNSNESRWVSWVVF